MSQCHGWGSPGAHASSSLSCARARFSRDLTVPCGICSSKAASRVVSPSSTVSCSTTRSSGEIRASAGPISAYSSREQQLLLGGHVLGPLSRRAGPSRTLVAAAQPGHQAPDRDSPEPGRHLTLAPEAAPFQAATNVSCSTSATASRSAQRRARRAGIQAACRSYSKRSASESASDMAVTSSRSERSSSLIQRLSQRRAHAVLPDG